MENWELMLMEVSFVFKMFNTSTVELRPDRNDRRGFAPGPEEIIPTGEESFEATVAIAQSL